MLMDSSRSIREILDMFGTVIWEDTTHRSNTYAFLDEISEILKREKIVNYNDQAVDIIVKNLRNKNNSNATINRKLAALFKLLRKAERAGLIMRLPSYVRLPEKQGRIRFLTLDEEDRMFAQIRARNESHYRLCVFLVDTGARVGEALALKHNDCINGDATFWLTKSGKSRSVPLTVRAREAVAGGRHLPQGPFSDIKYQNFRYDWIAAKKGCGLTGDDQVVPHILRHTCASRLVQAGIDLRRVQTFLGHQSIQMTLKYAHLATKDLDQCVSALHAMTRRHT